LSGNENLAGLLDNIVVVSKSAKTVLGYRNNSRGYY
jgi:hypothetical protein